ncbi:MAG: Serine/threonine-protein kinase pkn1 [Planctomycetota bacterium]
MALIGRAMSKSPMNLRTAVEPLTVALAVAVLLAAPSPASASDRTALVIANSDYGEHQLAQVKSDATAMAEALKREGFRVTLAENIGNKELKNSVEQFAKRTVTRGVSVLYFAGLAGQYQTYNSKGAWWNHLQGAGRPSDPRNPERDSLALPEIVKLFTDHSAATTNLLVLDVARPNPFHAGRGDQRAGLAPLEASELPNDMLVLTAAGPNTTVDGPSPFAAAMAKHLPRGRESVAKMIAAVSDDVKRQSGGKQHPTFTGSELAAAAAWSELAEGDFAEAESIKAGSRPGLQWINAAGMVFCWCPPGKFQMGSLEPARAGFEDAQQVEVTLTSGFWIGKYEVTQLEASRMKSGASRFPFPGKHVPLHMIQHEQAAKLAANLNDVERKAGRLPKDWEYALPTEAQWEYACRAGTTTRYSFGNDDSQLCRHANYADKSLLAEDGASAFSDPRFDDRVGRSLAIVGSYAPNPWGLHDMHGNVAEWCADRYAPQLVGGVNPLGDGKQKDQPAGVIRGGAWCSMAIYCESAFRNSEYSGGNAKGRDYIGVRLVLRKQ